MCVEISSDYIIDRVIPFSVQSMLTLNTTAEGKYTVHMFQLLLATMSFVIVDDFVEVSEHHQFDQNITEPVCFSVHPQNDMILEEDESFLVAITAASPPVSHNISQLTALVIIKNDDSKNYYLANCNLTLHHYLDVTVEFEATNSSVPEGTALEVCLILAGNSDFDVTVTLQVEDGTTSMFDTYKIKFIHDLYCVC